LGKNFTLTEGIYTEVMGRKWLRAKSLTENCLGLKSVKKVKSRAYNFYPKQPWAEMGKIGETG